MDKPDLTEKQLQDMTKLIKVISESIKNFIENDSSTTPGSDVSLYAMQVLSVICGLNRGYTKLQIDQMWDVSNRLSNKLHAAAKGDKPAKFQSAVDYRLKN